MAHQGPAPEAGAAVRDRIYVSSRTSWPENGLLANEEESIYGRLGQANAINKKFY
jgi:hypothetical protein